MTDLQPYTPQSLAPALDRAAHYAQQSRAASTRRAYRTDWSAFVTWCAEQQLAALPASPGTVAAYIAHLADTGRAVATISRRLASISQAHQLAGHASPSRTEIVRTTMKGIRREKGSAQRQAAPATTPILKLLLDALPGGLVGKRDRALLLIGFAGAFRRSELAALQLADIRFQGEGVVITLRHSKTDQERAGREIGIPYGSGPDTCPVRALRAWIDAAGLASGGLFRAVSKSGRALDRPFCDRSVALVVQRAAARAGLNPKDFSGHSLRAGLATSAAAAGVADRTIMQQTGHKSRRVLDRYVRRGALFRDNAAGKVGL